jgi:cell division protein FtsN
MRRLILSSSLLLLVVATGAEAQVTSAGDSMTSRTRDEMRPANDSLFRRARRLVGEGNGVVGRALVDSLMRLADPATPAYGDALYWHGVVALTAGEAERDYRRVIVEYPLAYYKDDALLALAELEQARGDRAGALAHLQRYVREHGAGKERGIAALGAARLAFEQRDVKTGCSMLAEARVSAAPGDVELRNQIDAYGSRCSGQVASTTTPTSTPVNTPPPTVPIPVAPTPVPVKAASETVVAAAQRPAVTRTTTMPSAPVAAAPRATVPPTGTSVSRAATESTTRSSAARPSVTPPTSTRPSTARSSVPHPAGSYTVQLAAYETRSPAEALVAKLATRGVKARVSGTSKPFRVRLDFYRTRQEAADVVAALKKRGMIGFVTEEAPPAEAKSP